jgi:predicted nucleic acid-binding protein
VRTLFVDTGAWLAIADRDDQHHRRAAAFYRAAGNRVRWVTSDYVLDELATRLRAVRGAHAAVTFIRAIRRSPICQVRPVTDDAFEEALVSMLKFSDHRLSFTDCTSFALMNELCLREAFSFDGDFARCGYTLVP